MPRLPALVAAVLLPVSQPLLLGTTVFSATLLVSPAPAQAQSGEAVAKVAQAITVRIEGATQGSGVLMQRDGNRYTVLTAWHVVSAQRPGEELAIYTPDGRPHPLEAGSIRRLSNVDLAVLTFSSTMAYQTARIGDRGSVQMGGAIFISGFPLPSTAVPSRLLRFLDGQVIANAQVVIPNGYQLLYSNPTLPGMSGGPVFNSRGEVVGIHGQGETDAQMSEQQGVAVKTGTNQGVPIAYYAQAMSAASGSAPVDVATATARTADDYLAQAWLVGTKGQDQEMIRLSTLALAQQQSSSGYFLRGLAKIGLKDIQGAIGDYNQAISIDPRNSNAYINRAVAKDRLGDYRGAISDYDQAISIKPRNARAYAARGHTKGRLGDYRGAIADFDQAIGINPRNEYAYSERGAVKRLLGDTRNAIADFDQAISIKPRNAIAYNNRAILKDELGDYRGAISDYDQAISIEPRFASAYTARGLAKGQLGDRDGSCKDFAASLRLRFARAQGYWDKFCQ
ncbi:serine protease [Cyanobium sp. BA20m-p-22]|uniref:tetratricopeptide repeat-containing S1 family peptidase n=1 Tax=Cyanobium sp. BA20m-p-22 TaxID=2823704 RepID=UPI0020CEADEF|nr:tetratricopeptide repeat-containing serine protease family protein [Cyanobium sp. BA20m-p-22]MCP9909896.1 serine protease [Cyanobium sp. BA20m-p-22]